MAFSAERVSRRAWDVACGFGLMHAMVDAASVCLLFWSVGDGTFVFGDAVPGVSNEVIAGRFLLYNTLAFATQFSIGAIADRFRAYRGAAMSGILLTIAGMAIGPRAVLPAIVLAALGNAGFHVGAGAIVLRLSPRTAAPAGIVVGPGAIGLAVGICLGKSMVIVPWAFILPLAAVVAIVFALGKLPDKTKLPPLIPSPLGRASAIACAAAIFLCIAIRSSNSQAVGAIHEWHADVQWGLAAAACLGNILGGFIADRLGWIKTCLLALVLSAPLLSFFARDAAAVVAGMLLFQMTMPITLAALYRLLPHEPGFAFGLGALGVFAGAVPVLMYPCDWIAQPVSLLTLSLISIAAIGFALPLVLPSGQPTSDAETEEPHRQGMPHV